MFQSVYLSSKYFYRKAAGTNTERYTCKDAYYVVVGVGEKLETMSFVIVNSSGT